MFDWGDPAQWGLRLIPANLGPEPPLRRHHVLRTYLLLHSEAQYAIEILWIVESFPQHIQSTSFAAIQTLGEVGKFVSPILVRAANSKKISPALVITAVDLLLGLGFFFCLKETLMAKKRTVYEEP